jgi:hypothetical protein
MKVGKMALANAIKCGPSTIDFLTADHFDIEIKDGIVVHITSKEQGQQCFTTLMNVKWWHPVTPEGDAEVVETGKRRRR